jgi:lipopolysaccharide/colanic/teichoic acid biosynthesis glycosyltransferase
MENTIKISIPSTKKSMWFSDRIKRLFDILVSLAMLAMFSPFYIIVALAIKRDTPGPVFYRGARMGRKGKYFKILKFRTMYETPQSYAGPRVTAQDDPRITPLGRWLRDTKMNEFPQFWNVLKGEMSLVGPRPEDPSLAKTWPAKIAGELMTVRPGITSPASVLYRNEENMLHTKEALQKYLHILTPDKMRLDLLYVRYRSFWLDLDVILWTALLLLPKIKEYSPPEKILFLGPITRIIHRYASWFLFDFLVAFASIGVTGVSLRLLGPLDLGWLTALFLAIGFSLLYSLVGFFLGVNRISWSKATFWDASRLFGAWVISTGLALIIRPHLYLATSRTFELILSPALLSLLGFVLIRYRSRLVIGALGHMVQIGSRSKSLHERVLIVGAGRTAEHIAWLFNHPAYAKQFQIVGFIDDDLLSQGLKVYGSRVIGTRADLKDIIEQNDVGLIILADYRLTESDSCGACEVAVQTSAKVFVAPDIFGALNGLGNSSSEDIPLPTDSFQCQHCIARYASYRTEDFYITSGQAEIELKQDAVPLSAIRED